MKEFVDLVRQLANAMESIDRRLSVIEAALQLLIEDSIADDLIFEGGEVS